jgi:hypothetical protein
MKKLLIAFIVLSIHTLSGLQLKAQPYMDNHGKYRFAQRTMGLQIETTPTGGTTYFKQGDKLRSEEIAGKTQLSFMLAGLHFWGHLDFSITFPVYTLKSKTADSLYKGTGNFEIIGTRYYPWRLENGKIRPYVGTSLQVTNFRQEGTGIFRGYAGPNMVHFNAPLTFGLAYINGKNIFELGAKWTHANKFNYPLDRETKQTVSSAPLSVNLTLRRYFENTASQFEKKEASGELARNHQILIDNRHRNAFSIGLGMSSAAFVGRNSFNDINYPYMSSFNIKIFPEFGVGYHMDKIDAHLNASYRSYTMSQFAYKHSQEIKRQGLGIEAYKFLTDYKGFVPFLGAGLSNEKLQITDDDQLTGKVNKGSSELKTTPFIIAGWDIRYHRANWFMLRTNIRYFPTLGAEVGSKGKYAFRQCELNFIQAVFYPERLYWKKKLIDIQN